MECLGIVAHVDLSTEVSPGGLALDRLLGPFQRAAVAGRNIVLSLTGRKKPGSWAGVIFGAEEVGQQRG